jgi:glucoamylase
LTAATRRSMPVATAWHWRRAEPFDRLPSGRTLLIESPAPFRLHHGFDGWLEVVDTLSELQGLGMHGVQLDASALSGHSAIDFTLYFPESGSWEGTDHHITLGSAG